MFKPFLDLDTQPVLFIPDVHFTNLQRGSHVGTSLPGEAERLDKKTPWRFSQSDHNGPLTVSELSGTFSQVT